MIYDVIIIGGGPSGLMACNVFEQENINYLLLEKNEKLAKKLLISGGKRCNVTNNLSIDQFIASLNLKHKKFLYHALKDFGPIEIIDFFKGHGLNLVLEDNLKYFPETQKSSSVLEALVKDLDMNRVKLNHGVKRIDQDNHVFSIHTAHEIFQSKHVVIATGSNSYPTTGSSGDGLEFARYLNVETIPFTPAETYIYSNEIVEKYKDLQGVSINQTKVKINGTNMSYTGGLLFTHFGLSGPVILHASEDIYQALLKDKVSISFSLIEQSREELIQLLDQAKNNKLFIVKFLETITTKKLAQKMIDLAGIENRNMNEIAKKDINHIIENLTNFTVSIDKVQSRDLAFVNAGGISTKELDPKSMEVKHKPGLYFIGETVDLHGPIGGFNITIALSSGHMCAKHISYKLKS
ncbi:MAG: NAD(P)/FAD-dependent oxidoreductase [Acholeplasmataceae bacterium]|nr:NAD(P)/FAD-dependent oxidoreductase [Acholeplasmataceae bacterium]